MFPESLKNCTRAEFLLFFHLIYMESTSSRIKKFWIPKPTCLLPVGSPDTLEMDDNLINGFQQIFPFLSRAANQRASSDVDHSQRTVHGKQLPSSLHSIILTSRAISIDSNKDKQQTEKLCWTLSCIRSVLQMAFVGEIKIYSVFNGAVTGKNYTFHFQ